MASRREGQNLGPYRLIEQIGEGGMATVYKAYQPSMERHVAVKILPPHYADDPQFAERFIREARTIAKLEHQSILPVYDFGEEKDTAYLVMRYLEGGTLKNVMKQGRLSLTEIENLFSQICSALDYAHRQGVIHRDVKPANIMIDTEGAAYLTDFGIAKVLKGVAQLTATGAAIGTPTYMAPEQSLAKSVDARSDTYALGVILYEMVVGKVPYEADTPMAVALAHIHEPLPMPTEIDPEIPESIEAVIIKAMAKEPDDRYQTASEISAALSKAVREATAIKPEPAETTLVDLVIEAQTAELEKVTRVVEEAVPEEPALEAAVLKGLPPIEEVTPRRRFPIRTIAIGGGGLAIVALVIVAAVFGFFGGGDGTKRVEDSMDSILAAATSSTPILTHIPTNTPRPTDTPRPPTATPTPFSTTVSGLIIFDDFNQSDGPHDGKRWWGGSLFQIEDEILKLRASKGKHVETELRLTNALKSWRPLQSGAVRFSIEVEILIDSQVRNSDRSMSASISLLHPDGPYFSVGYHWDPNSNQLTSQCYGGDPDYNHAFFREGGQVEFSRWYAFRFDIQERLDREELSLVGSVNGDELCTYTLSSYWGNAVEELPLLSLGVSVWWEDAWDLDQDLEVWFENVAVWPSGYE